MSAVDEVLSNTMRNLAGRVSALRSDRSGASALEFSMFAGLLIFGLLNTVDISVYIYKRMQLENATEMAAQAACKAGTRPRVIFRHRPASRLDQCYYRWRSEHHAR